MLKCARKLLDTAAGFPDELGLFACLPEKGPSPRIHGGNGMYYQYWWRARLYQNQAPLGLCNRHSYW